MWDFNVFAIALIVGFVLGSVYSFNLFKNRKVPGMAAFAMVFACVATWSLFGALELLTLDRDLKYTFSKLSYFGVAFSGVFTLVFALGLTENAIYKRFKPIILGLLLIIPLITLFLALSTEIHGLIWSEVEMITTPYLKATLVYSYGPWMYVFIGYTYLALALSALIIIVYATKTLKIVRTQLFVLVMGIITPWIANVIYIAKLNPVPGVDLTQISFLASEIMIWYAIFKGRFFEVRSLLNESLLQNEFMGIIYLDSNFQVIDKNHIAENYLDTNLSAGSNLKEILSPLGADLKELTSNQDKVFEVEVGKDNNKKWLRLRSTKYVINANKEQGYVIAVEDITQLKEAQNQINEKQRLLSMIMDSMQDLIFGFDSTGKIIFWNKTMEEKFKRTEAEMIGKTIEDLAEIAFGDRQRPFLASVLLGKDKEVIVPYYLNIKATDQGLSAEAKAQVQGQELNYWATAKKIFDPAGNMVGILETVRVVDELKKMEKQVMQTKSHFEAMIENTDDMITLLGKDMKLIAFNSAYLKWIKDRVGRDPVVGDNCDTLLKPDDRDWWRERNQKAMEGNKLTDLLVELKPDGSKSYLQVSFNPVRQGDQITGITHFMSDVTRQKQTEEELQTKLMELEILNKKVMQ